jgi:hypothetical protein
MTMAPVRASRIRNHRAFGSPDPCHDADQGLIGAKFERDGGFVAVAGAQ